MERNGQRADEHRVFALAAHLLREQFGVGFAEALGGRQFEVPILIDDARTFMDDDFDAGLAGLFQDGLQSLLVVRHDADDVDVLGDQIFDRTHL